MEWNDIKKIMPKEEFPYLVVVKDGKRRYVTRACHLDKYEMEADDFAGETDYDEETDTYYWPEGWYEWNEFEDRHYGVSGKVTHWMPLPNLPNHDPKIE